MTDAVEYLADTGWVDRPASSRAAGYLTNTLSADPDILATFYRRRLPDLLRFADSAVYHVEALLARYRIECEYERTGIVGAAVTPGQLRRARRMAKSLGAAGWDSEFIAPGELGLPDGFLGGVRERIGGLLNPGRYALGVRRALLASQARVFEQTPVREIHGDGARVRVDVPGGRVRAERIVLAANAYSRDLAIAPRRLATPLWVSQVETQPIAPERVDEVGWTSPPGLRLCTRCSRTTGSPRGTRS